MDTIITFVFCPDEIVGYTDAKKNHNYLITVDVARGLGNDYSAFIVFDITEFPYRVVAKYRNNEIKQMLFPNILHDVAK